MFTSEVKVSKNQGFSDNGWWAVYTRHQHEKTAADIMLAKGCEVFLP